MARFIAGEVLETTQTPPDWLKAVFGRELRVEGKQEKPARGR